MAAWTSILRAIHGEFTQSPEAPKVIIEQKSIERITNVQKKQFLTYLRLTDMHLGYLLNFGEALMKNGITRTVNGLKK